jgi:hypothetical protein
MNNKNAGCPELIRLTNEQYGTSSGCKLLHYLPVKSKELTPKQLISVPCKTCGAAIEEPCELHTGALRSEPHRDRKLSAADAVEIKSRQTIRKA